MLALLSCARGPVVITMVQTTLVCVLLRASSLSANFHLHVQQLPAVILNADKWAGLSLHGNLPGNNICYVVCRLKASATHPLSETHLFSCPQNASTGENWSWLRNLSCMVYGHFVPPTTGIRDGQNPLRDKL